VQDKEALYPHLRDRAIRAGVIVKFTPRVVSCGTGTGRSENAHIPEFSIGDGNYTNQRH